MPRQKGEVVKSDEIRALLRGNSKMPVKELVATLAERGISVTPNLVYFIKGNMRGRKQRARQVVETVARTTGDGDALKTILKVKSWAGEVGGLKKLKALVDALSE